VELQQRPRNVNSQTTHQPKQLDLFPAPAAATKQSRRNIAGRVKFFSPRQNKLATADESAPFDDDISDIGL
jgi:hypothetical protein